MKKALDSNSKLIKAVEHPSHYQGITIKGKNGSTEFEAIEIIDSIIDNLGLGPSASHAVGDALKYILRAGKKESDNSSTSSMTSKCGQDLMKSAWYLNRAGTILLESIEEK